MSWLPWLGTEDCSLQSAQTREPGECFFYVFFLLHQPTLNQVQSLFCLFSTTFPFFRGGFSFVKTLNVGFGICALIVHLRSLLHFLKTLIWFPVCSAIPMGEYYWSLMMYVRNQFMGATLLFACIQVMNIIWIKFKNMSLSYVFACI